jgi:hypothetical protein
MCMVLFRRSNWKIHPYCRENVNDNRVALLTPKVPINIICCSQIYIAGAHARTKIMSTLSSMNQQGTVHRSVSELTMIFVCRWNWKANITPGLLVQDFSMTRAFQLTRQVQRLGESSPLAKIWRRRRRRRRRSSVAMDFPLDSIERLLLSTSRAPRP